MFQVQATAKGSADKPTNEQARLVSLVLVGEKVLVI